MKNLLCVLLQSLERPLLPPALHLNALGTWMPWIQATFNIADVPLWIWRKWGGKSPVQIKVL